MKTAWIGLVLSAALAASPAAHAQSSGGVKLGTLSCHVSSGWGLIFGSSRDLNCTFQGMNRVEHYTGSITKFGVDVGYQQAGVMVWTVIAPTTDVDKPGMLAGKYGGGTASATVGVGLGANALIGGLGGSIALQPLSIEGSTGLNVAAGVAGLSLTHSAT
jgi:hypothetical protein